ncbi:hypothetical protein [Granulicella sp. S156]|jgi:hypothetical protein|uniref:hypothetical protein n=1 Tax=Granulicella sp. S156 TaxID=1747224 RepID=UPI00131CDCD8|nr:hypothetical protein [Granulicella sp. S156]
MDVHAPHEPVHTWRDFFTHLTIVTIGLFIALSLEAFVEYVHHRHLVHEARENIRQEIEDNHKAAQEDITLLQQDLDRTNSNLDTIRRMRANPKTFKGTLTFTMSFNSLHDAAWNSARDTGALGFMPYKEVQGYADLYQHQKLVDDQVIEVIHRQTLAMTPIYMENNFTTISTNQTESLLHDTAATLIDVTTLQQIVQQLNTLYIEALKKQ